MTDSPAGEPGAVAASLAAKPPASQAAVAATGSPAGEMKVGRGEMEKGLKPRQKSEMRRDEMYNAMQKMIGMIVMLVVVLAGFARAQDVKLLTINESARWGGATHVVEIDYDDLTTTTTNTAQVLTVDVLNKQGVEVVCAVLETAFVDAATNANNTLTLIVGDGGDTDRFLASHELCSDGTEVFLKYGTGTALAYTADDTIDFTITPHASYGVAAMDAGKVRVYLRVLDAVSRLR